MNARQQVQSDAIILARTDFGEADRILTVLTPAHGKIRLMARGVRRVRSKLAGGIELFSVSQVTYIPGRGEIGTLVSARLEKHYGHIVEDISRTMLGYDLIKRVHKNTEDNPESDYFDLLQLCFAALNERAIHPDIINFWFQCRMINLAGHSPNLQTDTAGDKLLAEGRYAFDFDAMTFVAQPEGRFGANHIKVLRLLFSQTQPQVVQQVQGIAGLLDEIKPLVATMATTMLRA